MARRDGRTSRTGGSGSGLQLRLGSGCRAALVIGLSMVALLAASPSAPAATLSSAYGPVYERLPYGPEWRQVLDVFASTTPKAPIVVLVHGGGWRFYFALSQFASESEALQAQGFTVFDITYRQDSETKPAFPVEPNDVMLATRWAIANAARFNADPGNVTLLGGSAGGHLVSLAAEQLDAASPGTVKGVVTLSAPTNFMTLLQMIQEGKITNEDFIFSVQQALGRDPGTNVFATRSEEEAYPQVWSPALHVGAQGCPKWLLFNSEAELIPLSQAQEMDHALLGAGCRATLQVVPGTRHAFGYFPKVGSTIFSFVRSP
jgi:acetyl esterase/lipase